MKTLLLSLGATICGACARTRCGTAGLGGGVSTEPGHRLGRPCTQQGAHDPAYTFCRPITTRRLLRPAAVCHAVKRGQRSRVPEAGGGPAGGRVAAAPHGRRQVCDLLLTPFLGSKNL